MPDNLFCPSPKGATWAGWALLKVCPGLISEKKKLGLGLSPTRVVTHHPNLSQTYGFLTGFEFNSC